MSVIYKILQNFIKPCSKRALTAPIIKHLCVLNRAGRLESTPLCVTAGRRAGRLESTPLCVIVGRRAQIELSPSNIKHTSVITSASSGSFACCVLPTHN